MPLFSVRVLLEVKMDNVGKWGNWLLLLPGKERNYFGGLLLSLGAAIHHDPLSCIF